MHTPESETEKLIEKVRQKVKANGMRYPIAVDRDGKTWNAWDNRSWPSVYLIDKKGVIRYRWEGELNWGETKGEPVLRKKIEELLAEES